MKKTFYSNICGDYSCSVNSSMLLKDPYGPKNRILIWDLFWECRSVAVAPPLDGMSEEQEKLYVI